MSAVLPVANDLLFLSIGANSLETRQNSPTTCHTAPLRESRCKQTGRGGRCTPPSSAFELLHSFSYFLMQGFLFHLEGAMNKLQEEIKTKDKTCQQLGELVSQLREKLDRTERQSSINSKRVGKGGTEHVHSLSSLADQR